MIINVQCRRRPAMMMIMMMTTEGEGSQIETRDYSLIETNTPEALFRFRFSDVRFKVVEIRDLERQHP